MLPDFPSIKQRAQELLTHYLRSVIRREPLLSQIKSVKMFEGKGLASINDRNEPDQSTFKELRTEMTIDKDEIIAKGIRAYVERVNDVARNMQKQQAEMVFKRIEEVTERIGNVVDGKGRPFDFEMFYSSLEKVWIEFDNNGQPHLPTLFVSPELGSRISKMMPEWEKNEDYNRRMKQLMDRKKKDWDDRESNRKLVD